MKELEVGVQTYTYRKFDVPSVIKELKGTGITALEVFPAHLSPATPPRELANARKQLADAGLRICGIGVCGFSSERPDEMRRTLQFAADIGCDYVSMDVRPDDSKGKDVLVRLALDHELLLAIHNHGPGHHYDTAENVLRSCEGYDLVLGACVDTGHFLRVGQTPEHAIEVLGKRVHAVHLKDFVDAQTEVVPGTGKLSYATALAALREHSDFRTALVIEYEADPDNPTPGMRQTVRVLKEALKRRR